MSKLDWNYDRNLDCEVAYLRGYRIKAERDCSPDNPFNEWDGNWPIMVYSDRSLKLYEKTPGIGINRPLERFSDAQLLHDQKAIADALDADREGLIYHMPDTEVDLDDDGRPITPRWCTNTDALRSWFDEAFDGLSQQEQLNASVTLFELLGIPAACTTTRGYSQGDWAEVLVVATPEAQEQFGNTAEYRDELVRRTLDETYVIATGGSIEDEVRKRAKDMIDKDLEATVDLYGYWAWGDVYGYVIERPVFDEHGDIEDWEDIDEHGSCWGFFGDDHAESGLEDAALECVPEEPVRSPDNVLEDA